MSPSHRLAPALLSAGYAAGWTLVRRLPVGLADRAFLAGAELAIRRDGRSVQRLRTNLARVLPPDADLEPVVREGIRRYARYWLEVFRLPAVPPHRLISSISVDEEPRLRAAHAQGRGVILALPHMGNWDHAGAWATLTGLPFTTVAERLEPEALFERFVAFRESLGMEVIPLSGGEHPPFELLERRLRSGGMLCLLADRDLTPTGVEVSFFGSVATMPAGPALLALRTGAVLLPVTLWQQDPRPGGLLRARIHPAVPDPGEGDQAERIAVMTQQVADAFAEGIAAHPEDWHMLQRLWRADLAARPA